MLYGAATEAVLVQLAVNTPSVQTAEGFSRKETQHDARRLNSCHVLWSGIYILFDWSRGIVHGDGVEEMIPLAYVWRTNAWPLM